MKYVSCFKTVEVRLRMMEMFNLHRACEEAWVDKVSFLLDSGEDINRRDNFKRTPLHCAIGISYSSSIVKAFTNKSEESERKYKITELLLSRGANANIIGHNASGVTPLHLAASLGNRKLVDLLLKFRANPNYQCGEGKTPLHVSARCGYQDIAMKLIQNGSLVNSTDYKGRTPLYDAAMQSGDCTTIRLLIKSRASVNWLDYKLKSPLHYSIKLRKSEVSKVLLENGADVLLTDEDGLSPLHYSINSGDLDLVKLTLAYNANINAKNTRGNTALHLAVLKNNYHIVQLLLRNTADPNTINYSNQSPLHIAILQSHPNSAIVSKLLEYDADIRIVNNKNKSSLALVMDPQFSSKTKELIISHALILKAANLIHFDNNINKFLDKIDLDFYSRCINEVTLLKENKLDHILTLPINKLINILRNVETEHKLSSYNYSNCFPIYSKLLTRKIKRALDRKKLFILAEHCLNILFESLDHWPRLPPECFPLILNYFTDRDLKMLIEFSQQVCQSA